MSYITVGYRRIEMDEFKPDWDAMAVMVEEHQRMAKRIEELEFYTEELGQGDPGRGVLRAVIDFLKEKNSTTDKNIQISDNND